MKADTAKEAERILKNMYVMAAGYHGTTTVDVVDYMAENYNLTLFCNGSLRNIVFKQITPNNYSFKTEAI